MHSKAWSCKATRTAHWQQRVFRAVLARMHRSAPQGKEPQIGAAQSNADWSLATGSFPGRFGPNAPLCTALQGSAVTCTAPNRSARQSTAFQSNADRGLATDPFPGRFGPSAAQSTAVCGRALHCMARQFKATRTAYWQQWVFRAVLPIRPGFLGRFINRLTTEKTTWP